MKYENKILINGQVFTHAITADSYKEALKINKQSKENAAQKGRIVFGRLKKIIS